MARDQRKKQPTPDPEESERAWAAISRYQAVQRRIAEWCASGTVRSALRPYEGGEVVPLEPAVWNTELFWSRFDECRMHADDPFNTAPERRSSQAAYIFLARDDLDRLLSAAQHRVVTTAAAETKCRRWLESEMRKSPTHRPRAKGAFFSDAQSHFPDLSKKAFNRAWATAVRDSGATAWSSAGAPMKGAKQSPR
jgi:hypothetical protein